MSRSRLALLAVVALVAVVGLRLAPTLGADPVVLAPGPGQLVVVGVEGRTEITETDRQVVTDHDAQVGAVSIRANQLGECAAAGWATLGAGRRAGVGGLCDIRTTDFGVVYDWRARQAAAAAAFGDARLGALASLAAADGGECVASVGPGAALAAANPDGTSTAYLPVDVYLDSGFVSSCPITLVDAGDRSDEMIAGLVGLPDTTVIVTGIGPGRGSTDPSLQVVYRVGEGSSGWLTAASTRRPGVIQLTDLTRAVIDFAHRDTGEQRQPPVDGSPLAVHPSPVSPPEWERLLRSMDALSDVPPRFYLAMGAAGAVALAVIILGLWTGRFAWPHRILAAANVGLATMMLVGVSQWWRSGQPMVALSLAFALIIAVLTWLVLLLARRLDRPVAVVAAAVSAAAFTAEALSGAWAEAGSMLNSRPIFAWRWYGFGNVTFAAYAAIALLVAGAFAAAQARDGGRVPGWRAAAVVLAVGLVMVVCQGWPTMGSDFGGVMAMVPGLLWLTLRVAGARVRWWVYPLIGVVAVAAVGVVAWLDWLRAPDDRSHLGRFVQRLLDGDAADLVARKAVAMVDTVVSPLGLGAIVVGGAMWVVVFWYAVPRIEPAMATLRPTAVAVLVTAVLGTVVNDGGISVFITATIAFVVAMAVWLVEQHRFADRPRTP